MSEWVTGVVEAIGYPGIAVLMFLEIPVPVIQSEIVMTFSGFSASAGRLSLVGVVLAGIVGSQVGSLALYAVARRAPEERVRGFLSDHGTWLGFTDENLRRAEQRFTDHGALAVLIGRLLPGLRSFIAVPAGLLQMRPLTFFVFNLIGTAFWVSVLAWLGSLLGQQYRLVDRYSSYVSAVFLGGLVLLVAYRVISVRRARARQR